MNRLHILRCFALQIAAFVSTSCLEASDTPTENEKRDLKEVQTFTADHLQSVTCVSASKDGKFLYASAMFGQSVSVFKREADTGKIEEVTWMGLPEFGAIASVRLSPDNQYAVSSAMGSSAVVLFKRDAETGELELADSATEDKDGKAGLGNAADSALSPDNRFLYAATYYGVSVLKLEEGKLAMIAAAGGVSRDVRSIVLSPDGATLYAACTANGSIEVYRRDPKSGELASVQMIADGKDDVTALDGVFRLAISPDGKNLYASVGRWGPNQAIIAFEVKADGKVKLIKEYVNGTDGFTGFEGGNSIAVSPDGKYLCAVGSISDQIVRFRRDPASGKLTFLGTQAVGAMVTPGAAGVCFSPDGKFVYVADEKSNSIVVLQQPSL